MLRVGMGALVALSGLAVTETLQVTTLWFATASTEPEPDTLPELGENDWAKDGRGDERPSRGLRRRLKAS